MARPRKSPQQEIRAWEMFASQGFSSATSISLQLDREFEKSVSLRTVENWVRRFKTEDDRKKMLDAPFQWRCLEKYGIPWEASPYLLKICRLFAEGAIFPIQHYVDGGFRPLILHPTGRHAQWWWRMHLSVPDANIERVCELAQRFVNRELEHEVLGEPLYMDDLEGLLRYRYAVHPEDEGAREEFWEAVAAGHTPPLQPLWSFDLMRAAEAKGGDTPMFVGIPQAEYFKIAWNAGMIETRDKQEAAPPDQGGLSKS